MLSISPSLLKDVSDVRVSDSAVLLKVKNKSFELKFKYPEDAHKFKELITTGKRVLEGEFLYKVFLLPFPVLKASKEKLVRGFIVTYIIEILQIFRLLGNETEAPLTNTLNSGGLKGLKELLKGALKKPVVKSVLLKSNLGPVWVDVRQIEKELGVQLSGAEELIFGPEGVYILQGIRVFGPVPPDKFEGWVLKK